MVTCKVQKCLKRTNLNDAGFCQDHANSSHESVETQSACKCGGCNLDVPDDSDTKALCCDTHDCKVWYHLECTNVSEQLYELMNEASKDQDSGVRWICPQCRKDDPAIKLVTQETREWLCFEIGVPPGPSGPKSILFRNRGP